MELESEAIALFNFGDGGFTKSGKPFIDIRLGGEEWQPAFRAGNGVSVQILTEAERGLPADEHWSGLRSLRAERDMGVSGVMYGVLGFQYFNGGVGGVVRLRVIGERPALSRGVHSIQT